MQYQYLSEKEKNELASGLAGDGVIAEEGKINADRHELASSLAGDGILADDGKLKADPAAVRDYIRLKSSTASSTKVFRVTVDDTGTLTATEET